MVFMQFRAGDLRVKGLDAVIRLGGVLIVSGADHQMVLPTQGAIVLGECLHSPLHTQTGHSSWPPLPAQTSHLSCEI